MRDRNFIESLARGLEVLSVVGASEVPLGLTEIAKACGLNKPATQRSLHTLVTLNYLQRLENKYTTASRTITLAHNALNNSNLTNMSKVYLDELSLQLNVTVSLMVLNDTSVIFLYRREINQFLKYNLQAGSNLPIHCTSGGKILAAYLQEEKLTDLLDRLDYAPFTPNTITTPERLLQDVKASRQRGYAKSIEELATGLCSYAVPIFDASGLAVGSVALSLTLIDTPHDHYISTLMATAKTISNNLNYKGEYPKP